MSEQQLGWAEAWATVRTGSEMMPRALGHGHCLGKVLPPSAAWGGVQWGCLARSPGWISVGLHGHTPVKAGAIRPILRKSFRKRRLMPERDNRAIMTHALSGSAGWVSGILGNHKHPLPSLRWLQCACPLRWGGADLSPPACPPSSLLTTGNAHGRGHGSSGQNYGHLEFQS